MTPDEKSILEETRSLALENNQILRDIQKHQRVSTVLKIAYWVILIALSLGAYYLIQPYVDTLKESVNDITDSTSSLLK